MSKIPAKCPICSGKMIAPFRCFICKRVICRSCVGNPQAGKHELLYCKECRVNVEREQQRANV